MANSTLAPVAPSRPPYSCRPFLNIPIFNSHRHSGSGEQVNLEHKSVLGRQAPESGLGRAE